MARLALLAGVLASVLGCARPQAPVEPLRIGAVRLPLYGLLYVAEERRLFEKHGVEVTFRWFDQGRDALDAALRGELDLATVYEAPFVLRALEGAPVAAITTLHRARRLSGLVVRADRGLRTVADLGGRRIGVTPRTNVDFLLDVLLVESGLQRGDVVVVHGPQPALIQQFADGELDAAALWTPNLQLAQSQPTAPAIELTTDVYMEISTLAGRADRLPGRAAALERLLRALAEAEQRIAGDEGELVRVLAPRFDELTPAQLRDVVSRAKFELGLSNLLLTVLRQEAIWFEREGVVRQREIDWRSTLLPEPLARVAPEAVTLLSVQRGEGG